MEKFPLHIANTQAPIFKPPSRAYVQYPIHALSVTRDTKLCCPFRTTNCTGIVLGQDLHSGTY
jgi:hypothetical protein